MLPIKTQSEKEKEAMKKQEATIVLGSKQFISTNNEDVKNLLEELLNITMDEGASKKSGIAYWRFDTYKSKAASKSKKVTPKAKISDDNDSRLNRLESVMAKIAKKLKI